MWFDISKMLIISQEQFDSLISLLGCNLTVADSCYMCTYLFANLFAYIMIFIIIKVVMFMYYQIFNKKKVFR